MTSFPDPRRIATRYLEADLSPPLGKGGGPCQVLRRVEQNVRDPDDRKDLTRQVMRDVDLSNPDAALIYRRPLPEAGPRAIPSPLNRITVGAHAQYRMDLRGAQMEDIRGALENWWAYVRELPKGHPDRAETRWKWKDPETGLTLVFTVDAGGLFIVTLWWEGVPNPKAPPTCPR